MGGKAYVPFRVLPSTAQRGHESGEIHKMRTGSHNRRAGLASGINNASSRVAQLAGVAIGAGVGSLAFGYQLGLTAAAAAAAAAAASVVGA